jgi:hypothetical protein
MLGLADLQSAFARALLAGADELLAGEIVEDGLAGAARLQIYRNHVFATLTDVLADVYPVVCRLVDERFFRYAADRFIRERPPASPCLHEYGSAFPAFLAGFPPCRDLAYLPDVARLEWAVHRAAHAEDAPPMDRASLEALSAEQAARLRLGFHPSLSLLESAWPVDRIWSANQPGPAPTPAVDLAAGGVCLEVRRLDDDVIYRRLDPATQAFRAALWRGATLESAALTALGRDPEFDLTAALHALLGEGIATAFDVGPARTEVPR